MQCRSEWKLARVASADNVYVAASPGRDRPRFRMACGAGDLPVALQLRDNPTRRYTKRHTCISPTGDNTPRRNLPQRHDKTPHMQCRGEWKLARVAYADDVYVAASRAGIFCVFAWFVLRATFQSPLQLRDDLQGIINDCPYRQCRGEWKLARGASADDVYVAASPCEDILCFRMVCVAGDLPVAPTATRWATGHYQ